MKLFFSLLALSGCAVETLNALPPGDYSVYQGDASGTRVTVYDPCDSYEPTPCYDGPIWKTVNAPCRAGLYECHSEGEAIWLTCEGAVYPREEQCSLNDENCNGIVNDGLDLSPYDIVVAVDFSGSMCTYLPAVLCAVRQYTASLDTDSYRIALISFTSPPPERVRVILPMGPVQDAYDALASMECNGIGSEASYDALDMVYNLTDPLDIGWRQWSKRAILMFLDEPGQSYTDPKITRAELLYRTEVQTFIWGKKFSNYKAIAETSGGMYFTLTSNCDDMAEEALTTISKLCQ